MTWWQAAGVWLAVIILDRLWRLQFRFVLRDEIRLAMQASHGIATAAEIRSRIKVMTGHSIELRAVFLELDAMVRDNEVSWRWADGVPSTEYRPIQVFMLNS